jgi:hypothetical protein
MPTPIDEATDICPTALKLYWEPTDEEPDPNHDVYFGTDFNDVCEATRASQGPGVLYHSENQDSNEYAVPASLQISTTYYWRVDEVNTVDGTVYDLYPGDRVWQFTTEDGNARDPIPNNLRGYNPTDAVLTWTPSCIATGQTVYFSTDFSDVNTMQAGAIEDDTLSGTDNNCPVGTLETYTTYYWRIKTDSGGNGEVWTFKTGYGGLILEMLFEGSLGADLPATELDTSGNDLHFTTFSAAHDPCADGSAKYAGGRFDGTSAVFDPCAGLYRLDPCGPNDPPDMLRLDGHQYTIELWFKPETLTDAHGDIMLIGKSDGPWAIRINNPGDEDMLELIHNGDAAGDDDWALQVGEWHHIAAVYDQLAGFDYKVRLYYNGVLLETEDGGPNPSDNNEPVGIGMEIRADGTTDGYFDGLIDQVRIWDTVVEPVLECATEPHPADVRIVLTDAGPKRWDACDPDLDTFTWKPGAYAASVDGHNIYFGDSIDDVNESADPCVTGHDSNSWTHGMTLEAGKTYYWRVDEVNSPTTWTGLIWVFQTQAELIDPNIVVYYPLDETSGRDVLDYSGRYFDAECDDDPHWEPNNGRFSGCMHFSMDYDAGDDDWDNEEPGHIRSKSNYGAGMANLINKEISICVWVNGEPNQRSDDDMVVFEFCDDDYDDEDGYKEEADNTKILAVVPTQPTERGNVVFRAGLYPEDTLIWTGFEPLAARGSWQHFVFIKNDNDANMYIYLNTELVATKKGCSTTSLADVRGSGDATLKLGAWVGASSQYHGRLDEFQIYNKQLDEQEMEKVFRGGELGPAWSPSPSDGQGNVDYDTDLTWKPGAYVASTNGHEVYFGTNYDEVFGANTIVHPNVVHDTCSVTSFDPCLLELGQTYYWRVDEVNDPCVWTGRVWRFTVADYITIDDMEDYIEGYSSDYPITRFDAGDYGWDCGYTGNGTGSGLDLVTGTNYAWVPARGAQSMAYLYANDAAYYSEISNHFELEPNDWTTEEVKMLTLWFYGEPENVSTGVEQMYVGLEDTTGGTSYSEVRYGDGVGEDINDIAIAEWQEWNIALNEFTTVNLEDVNKLYIGFGDRDSTQYGGSGLVYFDDIRLEPSRCVPSQRPAGFAKIDFNNDCIVDFGDIGIMVDEWLEADANLGQVTPPSDTNLIGWWKFDEGSGGDVNDSSGNGHHGTLETLDVNVWWVAGYPNDVNHALDFDGGRVRVLDHQDLRPMHQVSVCAWIKYSDEQNNSRVVAKGADDKETYQLEVDEDDDLKFSVRDGNDPNVDEYEAQSNADALDRDEWVHVAGTYDGNSLKAYVNGELVAENTDANSNVIPFLRQDINDLAIGNKPGGEDDRFIGIIDDVRVYDYSLSAQEVAYLASDGTGTVLLQSVANLVNDEPLGKRAVNFKDFDKLADSWLKEELFP